MEENDDGFVEMEEFSLSLSSFLLLFNIRIYI